MKTNQILIYGAPGAGKSSLSDALNDQTKIPLVHGDYIRRFPGTKSAWRKFGSLTKENVVKGLMYVRGIMHETVETELSKNQDILLEGVFIDPTLYHDDTAMFLIVTDDEAKHREQFFKDRIESEELNENFLAVQMIQEYLVDEAKNLNVKIIQNSGDIDSALQQFELDSADRADHHV